MEADVDNEMDKELEGEDLVVIEEVVYSQSGVLVVTIDKVPAATGAGAGGKAKAPVKEEGKASFAKAELDLGVFKEPGKTKHTFRLPLSNREKDDGE